MGNASVAILHQIVLPTALLSPDRWCSHSRSSTATTPPRRISPLAGWAASSPPPSVPLPTLVSYTVNLVRLHRFVFAEVQGPTHRIAEFAYFTRCISQIFQRALFLMTFFEVGKSVMLLENRRMKVSRVLIFGSKVQVTYVVPRNRLYM